MKKWIIVIAVFCLGGPFAWANPQADSKVYLRLDLKQCVGMALQNNPQIISSSHDVEISQAKLREAHPQGIPVLHYEHKIAPVPGDIDNMGGSFFSGDISIFNEFKVEAGSPITTFGKIKTAQELAQIGVDASWFQKDKTQSEIVFKIYQIYQGIILARELISLGNQANDTLAKKIDNMRDDKTPDQIGILKLKMALFEVQRKMEEAREKEQLAVSALKVQLGLEHDVDLNIKSSSLAAVSYKLRPLDYYLEEALEHRPEYKLLAQGVAAKEKKLKIEKLNYVPNFGVGGFVDIGRAPGITGGSDENNNTNPFNFTKAGVGFQLKGDFDYVKTSSRIKQSQADLLKTIYDKRAAVRGLQLDIEQTYLDIKSARNLLNAVEEAKKNARQMVFLTKSNLDIGLGEKKDYLDAVQSYLVFQGRELESIYNYNVAVYELKKKTGTLVDEFTKEIQ